MATELVGICGALGSGKSTVAEIMQQRADFERLRMAAPLKAMVKALGLTDEQVDGNRKEEPSWLLGGKTPRWAQQSIGTEWGRNLIDQDLWVRAVENMIQSDYAGNRVVIDDIRFPNEVDMIRRNGGWVLKVRAPQAEDEVDMTHASEKHWPSFEHDCEIDNMGGLVVLRSQVLDFLYEYPGIREAA